MAVGLIRMLAISAVIYVAPAQARELPHYDVEAYCEEVASFGGDYSASLDKGCINMEQEAYDEVQGQWPSLAETRQTYCDNVASFSGKGSYSLLKGCLQMEDEATKTKPKFKY